VGLTGAWLSDLRVLQPYSPILIGIAITTLALAGRGLFGNGRSQTDRSGIDQSETARSESGFGLISTTCRVDGVRPRALYRVMFWLVAALTLILLVTPMVAPWFY
jgi:mercuric ion transport protein